MTRGGSVPTYTHSHPALAHPISLLRLIARLQRSLQHTPRAAAPHAPLPHRNVCGCSLLGLAPPAPCPQRRAKSDTHAMTRSITRTRECRPRNQTPWGPRAPHFAPSLALYFAPSLTLHFTPSLALHLPSLALHFASSRRVTAHGRRLTVVVSVMIVRQAQGGRQMNKCSVDGPQRLTTRGASRLVQQQRAHLYLTRPNTRLVIILALMVAPPRLQSRSQQHRPARPQHSGPADESARPFA